MKYVLITLFAFLTGMNLVQAQTTDLHSSWSAELKKFVGEDGFVDYGAWSKDQTGLETYLKQLGDNPPKDEWPEAKRLAWWINAYNAFTVKLILSHYPLSSIKDIGEPWKTPFIRIGRQAYTLDKIEHEVIRKQFAEPRIHFAVNCASVSCPPLLNEAYTAEKLDSQLDQQTRRYLADKTQNKLSKLEVQISRIFEWFESDFEAAGGVLAFIQGHSEVPISEKAAISYLDYNWGLNGE